MNFGALVLIMLNFFIICGFVITRFDETKSLLYYNFAVVKEKRELAKSRVFNDGPLNNLLLEDE